MKATLVIEREQMPTEKPRLSLRIDPEIRRQAIEAMRKGETLTEFVEAALLSEIRRRSGAGEPSTPPASSSEPKLPRGRRPKT